MTTQISEKPTQDTNPAPKILEALTRIEGALEALQTTQDELVEKLHDLETNLRLNYD